MGFGAALAMGLVRGFTNNIQNEQKNRQLDHQQLSDLETLIADNALKGNIYNADAISGVIKDARDELNNKERIDLFGTATPRVRVDLSELGPLVTKPPKETDMISLLGGAIKFKRTDAPEVKMSEISNAMVQPQYQQAFVNAPMSEQASILSYMLSSQAQYSVGQKALFQTPDVDIDTGQNSNTAYPGLNWLTNYNDRNPHIMDLSATSGVNNSGDSIGAGEKLEKGMSSQIRIDVDSTAKVLNDRGVEWTTIGLSGSPQDIEDGYNAYLLIDKEQYATGVEAMMKATGAQDFKYALARWQQSFPMLGVSKAETKQAFITAIKMAEIVGGNPEMLDPDLDKSALYKTDQEVLVNIARKLSGMGADSALKIGLVLAPYMDYEKLPVEAKGAGIVAKAPKESLRAYALRNIMETNTQDPNMVRTDYEKFKTHGENVINTTEQLGELFMSVKALAESDEYNRPQALQLFFNGLNTTFNIQEGIVGGIIQSGINAFGKDANDIVIVESNVLDVNDNKRYTSSYDEELKRRVSKQREIGEEAARMEAMKIALAFKMARADDPSGRLSNQDIEAQYVKLGKSFSTRKLELAALRVTLEDFTRKANYYKPLLAVMAGGQRPTADATQFQYVDGVIAGNYILKQADYGIGGTLEQGAGSPGGLTAADFENADSAPSDSSIKYILRGGVGYYFNPTSQKIGRSLADVVGPVSNAVPNANVTAQQPPANDIPPPQAAETANNAEFSSTTHYVKTGPDGRPVGNNVEGYVLIRRDGLVEEKGRFKLNKDRDDIFERVGQ
tara:strand:- start:5097 stop:7460 length:2364 start_codon:yes stop_codon:yes gene_type:complete